MIAMNLERKKVAELRAANDELRHSGPVDHGGGGGDNGGMELTERIARVEEKVSGLDKRLSLVESDLRDLIKKVDSHFIVLAGMVIATAVGLAAMMAKGFHWM